MAEGKPISTSESSIITTESPATLLQNTIVDGSLSTSETEGSTTSASTTTDPPDSSNVSTSSGGLLERVRGGEGRPSSLGRAERRGQKQSDGVKFLDGLYRAPKAAFFF